MTCSSVVMLNGTMHTAQAVKLGLCAFKFYKNLGIESKKALTIKPEPSSFEFLDKQTSVKKTTPPEIVFTKCGVFVKGFSFMRVLHAASSI